MTMHPQRSRMLVSRNENENPVGLITKPYIQVEDTEGVPFEELRRLIGTPLPITLVSTTGLTTGWGLNDARSAMLLPHTGFERGAVLLAHEIKITIRHRWAGSVQRTWVFSDFAEFWLRLDAASAGDTLGVTTGFPLRSTGEGEGVYLPVTITIGRTATNQMLLELDQAIPPVLPVGQADATAEVDIEFITYAGGLVGRWFTELRAHQPEREITLKTRSATKPADPSGITIGVDNLPIIPADSPWVSTALADPSGINPLWYAFGKADYSHVTRVTTVRGSWVIVPGEQTSVPEYPATPDFYIRFGLTQTGPWLSTRTANSAWAQARNTNGSFSIWPIGDAFERGQDRDVSTLLWSVRFEGGTPDPHLVSQLGDEETYARFDLASYRFLIFEFLYDGSRERYWAIIPTYLIPTFNPPATSPVHLDAWPAGNGEAMIFSIHEGASMRNDNDVFSADGSEAIAFRFGVTPGVARTVRWIEYGTNYPGTALGPGRLSIRGF